MKSLFRCPICGAPLTREERSYLCPNRHSYDLSKEGYTHLLPANQKHSAAPGDDKLMTEKWRSIPQAWPTLWKTIWRQSWSGWLKATTSTS